MKANHVKTEKTNKKTVKPEHEKSRSTTITGSVVVILLCAFGVATIVGQFRSVFFNSLKTETAFYYEDTESVLFKGVFVRNEVQVISDEYANYRRMGIVTYTNKCGSKLPPNSVIAVVYSSEEDIYAKQRIAELNGQIETLTEAKKFAGANLAAGIQDNAQIDAFSGQLSDTHLRILRSISAGEYDKAASYRNEYLELKSKISVSKMPERLIGTAFDVFDKRIAELEAEIAVLESGLSANDGILRELTSGSESGYFVNNADGYEDILKFDQATSITREQIEEIIANPMLEVGDNVAGKVIDNYTWRMVAVIETDKTRGVLGKATVNLRIGSYPYAVPAQIVSTTDGGDGYTVFVFECELLNEDFVKKRVASVRLLLDDFSGIRLPRTAVVFDSDGNSGVYVKSGSVLVFRKIKMLRSEEGFVLIEASGKQGYLQLYDTVVISGKNLYNGKVVS